MLVLVALVPITILLVAGIVVYRLVRGEHQAAEMGAEQRAELGARMALGIGARAAVVKSQTIVAMPGRGAAAIQVHLDVEAPSGERYPASAKWEVDLISLSRLQPGQIVGIKIDPDDRTRVYPGESWARIYADGR
ncbi:hypothetical protein [Polyangium jinanense]|uniref:Uncharacterized protein n=1 Tax=Polyangium jinanense TaxID=2829994 RepID=A0A9X4APK4_9BACT|nr:hypothetical protein [Polyangium jinanense]MDC3952521.1 hypothetical protein [Polyangium jinanense]MDC3980149.1 hypothetical protein [Polyangium jinanense]